VRSRLAAVAADVARRYDIDGIHLDRIRYPGTAWSYDAPSLAEFGRDPASFPTEWRSYRMNLVNRMVKEAYDSATGCETIARLLRCRVGRIPGPVELADSRWLDRPPSGFEGMGEERIHGRAGADDLLPYKACVLRSR
jgi:hypothetical protein